MSIVIHGVPGSPYVRAPLAACEEKGVAWRLAALGAPDTKAPAHLARHPFGRVPALEHGDFILYETQAILRYIDQAFDGPALTPSEPRAQARMNQAIGVVDCYVMPSISASIAFNRVVKPMFGMPPDEDAIAAAMPMARTCIVALEAVLDGKPFLAGETVTLADLHAGPHFDFLAMAPEGAELLRGSPLEGWLARLNARPSFQKTTMAVLRAALTAEPA